MKKNPVLSFIRVVAMLSIIFGHWCTWREINTFQLGGIGVEIFLLLSGYLYGTKQIKNKKSWVKNRILRLMPPLWITVSLYQIMLLFLGGKIHVSSLLLYLFNIQGINRIIVDIELPTFLGMAQTWFITVIFLCYFLVALTKDSKFETIVDRHVNLFVLFSIILQIIMAYLGIQLAYIIQFFIGYFLSRKKYWDVKQNTTPKVVVYTTVLMVVMLILRLYMHHVNDGTILYDRIISRWSFITLALWVFVCILQFGGKNQHIFDLITGNKWWDALDRLSYPFFLGHYMFCRGETSVDRWISNSILQSICFFIFTIIIGVIIYFVNNRIDMAIKKSEK